MDLAVTSLDAYALFSAPRDQDTSEPPSSGRGPPPTPRKRGSTLGWWVAAFYGALVGAFMLGVTAGGDPLNVARCSLAALTTIVAAQAVLLKRTHLMRSAWRVAQGLTLPALAFAIAGLGALARLSA